MIYVKPHTRTNPATGRLIWVKSYMRSYPMTRHTLRIKRK